LCICLGGFALPKRPEMNITRDETTGGENMGYCRRDDYGFGWRRLLIFLLVIATIFVFAASGLDHHGYRYC
jgi:hypothetical protein